MYIPEGGGSRKDFPLVNKTRSKVSHLRTKFPHMGIAENKMRKKGMGIGAKVLKEMVRAHDLLSLGSSRDHELI